MVKLLDILASVFVFIVLGVCFALSLAFVLKAAAVALGAPVRDEALYAVPCLLWLVFWRFLQWRWTLRN